MRGPYGGGNGPYGPPGMRRGQIGIMGRPMPNAGGANRNGPAVSHHAFDPVLVEPHFGKAEPPKNETELNDALLKKTQQLTPTTDEQSSVQNLVSKVCFVKLIKSNKKCYNELLIILSYTFLSKM